MQHGREVNLVYLLLLWNSCIQKLHHLGSPLYTHVQHGLRSDLSTSETYRTFNLKILYNRRETIRQTTKNCPTNKDESLLHCCHSVKEKSVLSLCYMLQKRVSVVKQGITVKTVGWPCVLHPVSNVTIWWLTSRGVKKDKGSASGYKVSECKILVVKKCPAVWY
jgi:hypothetical protein